MSSRPEGRRSGNPPAGLPPNRALFQPGNTAEKMDAQRRIRRGEFDAVPGMRVLRRVLPLVVGVVAVIFLVLAALTALTRSNDPDPDLPAITRPPTVVIRGGLAGT